MQKEKDGNKAMKNNLLNIKNDKSNLNTNTQNSIKTRESEEKLLELESNLRQMKEEELNNDRHFKNFVNNVENNLNNFESKALGILGQKRQKSLEIKKEDYEASIENKNINKVSVISTLQASEEWSKQFHETLLAEKIAVIEGACLLGLIAMQVVVMIRKGWK